MALLDTVRRFLGFGKPLVVRAPDTPGLQVYRVGIDLASADRAGGMEAEVVLGVEPLDRALVFVALPPVPGSDPLFTRAGGKAEPSGRSAAATALAEPTRALCNQGRTHHSKDCGRAREEPRPGRPERLGGVPWGDLLLHRTPHFPALRMLAGTGMMT